MLRIDPRTPGKHHQDHPPERSKDRNRAMLDGEGSTLHPDAAQEIAQAEAKINGIVYELFDLTVDEIALLESAV